MHLGNQYRLDRQYRDNMQRRAHKERQIIEQRRRKVQQDPMLSEKMDHEDEAT